MFPNYLHGVELTDINLVMSPSPIMRTLIKEACLELWVKLGCKSKLDRSCTGTLILLLLFPEVQLYKDTFPRKLVDKPFHTFLQIDFCVYRQKTAEN